MRITPVLAAAALLLSACGTAATDGAEVTAAPADVTVANAYVRATDAGMQPYMTGAFMEITNGTDQDVTLTGGEAEFSPRIEVHEVVNGVMQMKEGGLAIPAGSTVSLAPGGNHLMFMEMQNALAAGDEVTFDLVFDDGSRVTVQAPVKPVNAGTETYSPKAMASESSM